jgi:hypothetical protein
MPQIATPPVRWCDRHSCDAVQVYEHGEWVMSPIKKQDIAIQVVTKKE